MSSSSPMPSGFPLEPSAHEMRKWIEEAAAKIIPYVDSLPDQPVTNGLKRDSFLKKIREPIPRQATELSELLTTIFDELLPVGINLPSAGYLAYIPVGGLFHTAIAEFVTTSINRWPGLYKFCPGFIEIEKTVIAWLNEMMGMPKTAGGILTSGGSLANFGGMVTARSEKLGEELANGVIYCSDQAHHSVLKAAVLAGISRKNVRKIKSDQQFRIPPEVLKSMIQSDLEQKLKPFLIVASAGTTNTGAIDPLDELAEIAKHHGLWFHVDAAWAGAFRMTKNGKQMMKGIEEADSITFDPHKALFLPFGSGALLVRDMNALKRAHSFEADYLPSENSDDFDQLDPSQVSPELSRTVRGLQVWLPMKMLGIQPFIDCLEEKLELTRFVTEELRSISGVEVIAEPQTAIVAFRYGASSGDLNALNQKLLDQINQDGSILLSGTMLHGKFAIRVVPFGHRTHRKHVEMALNLIKSAIANVSH